jgi:hypothetical protein
MAIIIIVYAITNLLRLRLTQTITAIAAIEIAIIALLRYLVENAVTAGRDHLIQTDVAAPIASNRITIVTFFSQCGRQNTVTTELPLTNPATPISVCRVRIITLFRLLINNVISAK